MALIKCPDCGKEISSEATTCVHCGRPKERKVKGKMLMFLGGLIMFCFSFLMLFDFSMTNLFGSPLVENLEAKYNTQYLFYKSMFLIGSLVMAAGILRDRKKDRQQKKILNYTCLAVLCISLLFMGGAYAIRSLELKELIQETPIEHIIGGEIGESENKGDIISGVKGSEVKKTIYVDDPTLVWADKLTSSSLFLSIYILTVTSLNYVLWVSRRREE